MTPTRNIGDTEGELSPRNRTLSHPEGTPDLADIAVAKSAPHVDSRECPRKPQHHTPPP
jgi:hypothetical protein